ncbi:LysR family transcriptional regulator [Streptomyces sp. NPDC002004]
MDLLAHLEAYVAAVDEASFSRAAERLGIAQPLLSRRIKTLEAHFGTLLFDRSRRQVATTDFGVILLPFAQDVLDRAERLMHVAGSARESAVRTVGVPSDCRPTALARIIRAGVEQGTTLGVHELPPDERVAGLADGSLAYAVLRVLPENAAFHVPLGLASAPAANAQSGAHPAPAEAAPRLRPRSVHLEDLRPRRTGGTTGERRAALPLLTMTEDQIPYAQARLERAVARAGLPEGLVRPAGPMATALAETLAGRVTLLCTEPFARQHGAGWAPLADASLHRGYDLGASRHPQDMANVPDWLAAILAAAVGEATTVQATADSAAVGADALSRLAARG